jgi:hypothetical protein
MKLTNDIFQYAENEVRILSRECNNVIWGVVTSRGIQTPICRQQRFMFIFYILLFYGMKEWDHLLNCLLIELIK